jgi:hypothetical protein
MMESTMAHRGLAHTTGYKASAHVSWTCVNDILVHNVIFRYARAENPFYSSGALGSILTLLVLMTTMTMTMMMMMMMMMTNLIIYSMTACQE